MADNSPIITKKISSFQQYVTTYIVTFVCFALVSSVVVTGYLFVEHNKNINNKTIIQYAKVISATSKAAILEDDHKILTEKLSRLSILSSINYIHVYKTELETGISVFFASFNSNDNFPAIPNQIDKKDRLSIPKSIKSGSEFILAIQENNQTIGYVYIQVNDNNLTQLTNTVILVVGSLIIIFIVLCFVISSRISNRLNESLNDVLATIQQASHDKDYNLVCPPSKYKEIDPIVRNINILLNRTSKHLLKLAELDVKNKKITNDLEEKVSRRTNALKESNQELLSTLEKLHQFQGQLVESEKMASLGDMVAGVAHEVNTPIGLGVTASTLLSDKLTEIQQAFDNKTLKSSDLKKFISQGQENLDIIYRNLKRAADLISSFKKVAVDQSNVDIRSFCIKELMDEVILTLGPQIYNTPYVVNIDCPEDLIITSKPGPINQIMINLILNSIIHGFEDRSSGTISISIMAVSHQLHIQFQDNGRGIDSSVIDKIFEPFTTTKRGKGGSGLGLHLVYNLVTQALGGNISLDESCENGVSFNIYFPIEINK